jgi:hypothetical protein
VMWMCLIGVLAICIKAVAFLFPCNWYIFQLILLMLGEAYTNYTVYTASASNHANANANTFSCKWDKLVQKYCKIIKTKL